jgi:ferric iron reductase protein FhuF
MNQFLKIMRLKCKQSLKMHERYDDMCAAIAQDNNTNQMTTVTMFLDKMARSTKQSREFKTWLSLYSQWRVDTRVGN